MFCKYYGRYVNKDNYLRKEYIDFSKKLNLFERNINLLNCLHGRDIVTEEEFPRFQDRITRLKLKYNLYRKSLNLRCIKTLFDIFHAGNVDSTFPRLSVIDLQIASTLPIPSATTERTLSKLKIIKNRLRSTTGNKIYLDTIDFPKNPYLNVLEFR